jgi:hypothetical protein
VAISHKALQVLPPGKRKFPFAPPQHTSTALYKARLLYMACLQRYADLRITLSSTRVNSALLGRDDPASSTAHDVAEVRGFGERKRERGEGEFRELQRERESKGWRSETQAAEKGAEEWASDVMVDRGCALVCGSWCIWVRACYPSPHTRRWAFTSSQNITTGHAQPICYPL